MDNIINEKKNLSKKIIYLTILSIVIFGLIGNLNLITMLCGDISLFSREDILKKAFSMSALDVGILYMSFGAMVYTVLNNKKYILKNYVKAKTKNNTILINKIKFLNQVIFESLLINLLIKFILYCFFKNTLLLNFNIGFDSLVISLLYITLVSIILYLMIYLNFVCIRDFISGTLVYCMIFANLSIVLGIGSVFVSDKILFIQNILNSVYNVYTTIVSPFYAFHTVYSKQFLANIINILLLSGIVLLMVYNLKKCLGCLSKENIKKYYINKWFRKIFYISVSVFLSYIVFLIGYLVLISFNFFSYDIGLLFINLIQVVLCVLLYIKLDKLYLNKDSLKKEQLKNKIKEKNKLNIRSKTKQISSNLSQNLEKVKKESKDDFYKNIIDEVDLENELNECEMIKNYAFSELYDEQDSEKDFKGIENELLSNSRLDKKDKEIVDLLNDEGVVKN